MLTDGLADPLLHFLVCDVLSVGDAKQSSVCLAIDFDVRADAIVSWLSLVSPLAPTI